MNNETIFKVRLILSIFVMILMVVEVFSSLGEVASLLIILAIVILGILLTILANAEKDYINASLTMLWTLLWGGRFAIGLVAIMSL